MEPKLRRKFVVVVSSGPDRPRKALTPFRYALAAASMGFETSMFFLSEAPSLLKRGVAESLRSTSDGEAVIKAIDLARKADVHFLCCSLSAKAIGNLEEGELPEGTQFAGAATLLEMSADPEVAVLYF